MNEMIAIRYVNKAYAFGTGGIMNELVYMGRELIIGERGVWGERGKPKN